VYLISIVFCSVAWT